MWEKVWGLDAPWWIYVLRAAVVFAFLLIILRLSGKRHIGQMTPFDLVLLLVISNAVQNSMNGGDNGVTAGLILAGTLVGIDTALGWAAYRSKKIDHLLEGRPVILIHNGKVDRQAMAEVQMTHADLQTALRSSGQLGPAHVRFAVLETTGKISVIPMSEEKEEPPEPAN